jgi:hypothetical protein
MGIQYMSRPEMEELASRAEHLMRLRKRKFLTEAEYARQLDELRMAYGLNPLLGREYRKSQTSRLG